MKSQDNSRTISADPPPSDYPGVSFVTRLENRDSFSALKTAALLIQGGTDIPVGVSDEWYARR